MNKRFLLKQDDFLIKKYILKVDASKTIDYDHMQIDDVELILLAVNAERNILTRIREVGEAASEDELQLIAKAKAVLTCGSV